jgi:uncharacterized sulfatase
MRSLTRLLWGAALAAGLAWCQAAAPRPNILWITSEDNGPQLGCYGDDFAITPNLDALAKKSVRYLTAWSCAPVCAPARTAIISGMYPPSLGGQHMRSQVPMPPGFKMYPQFLREAGYYCTNNSKEDYNLAKPPGVWDESSRQAHWNQRAPGQPFFAIFNHTISHESQIRNQIAEADRIHDPAKVRVPAYHPDTPEVRQNWAQYYDRITMMDARAGANLRELEEAGLAEDTIVFYYGDHGSGMPRSKRWPYNSGLHVPLLVHIPAKFQHLAPADYEAGGTSSRLVNFMDLAPTALSLAGIQPPAWMQGHAFLGKHATEPPAFTFGFRGRMDERYDLVRSVTDGRYVYLRQYMPHKIYGQHINYMFQTQTTRVWKKLHDEGRLTPEQDAFWLPKPPEELYDLQSDPDEVHNLVDSPAHREILDRLRRAQREQVFATRDLGFLPEGEIHARSEGRTPYEMGHDPLTYPLERIHAMADLASSLRPDVLDELGAGLRDPDSAVRYWAVLGYPMRGGEVVRANRERLLPMVKDAAPAVAVAAAEALGIHGEERDVAIALRVLMEHASVDANSVWTAMQALNAIDSMGSRADGIRPALKSLPTEVKGVPGRFTSYVPRLISELTKDVP